MFENIASIFTFGQPVAEVHSHDIWNDRDELCEWLERLFENIVLESTKKGRHFYLTVPPYRFSHDPTYLFSLDLLSIIGNRPENAKITVQDFYSLFCSSFLDFSLNKAMPQQEVSSTFGDRPDKSTTETHQFFHWICKMLLQFPEIPENKFLDYITPETVSNYLTFRSQNDYSIRKNGISHHANFVPLYVSIFFALHRSNLWPQIKNELMLRQDRSLALPVSIIEFFLNRWVDHDSRVLTITSEMVHNIFSVYGKQNSIRPDFLLKRHKALLSLRLDTKGQSETKQKTQRSKRPNSKQKNAEINIEIEDAVRSNGNQPFIFTALGIESNA